MAQTSSATREPSMEEILASIRRIIEDSDVTKQATADLTAAPAAARNDAAEAEKRGEVTQFPRPAPTAEAPQQAPSFSLDAVLRGTISEPAAPAAAQDTNTKQVNAAEQDKAEMHERNVAHVRIATVNPPVPPHVAAAAELPESPVTKPSEALLMHVAQKHVATQHSTAPAALQAAKQEDIQVTDSDMPKTPEKPLISRAAEEQVAASFGSLSQALIEEQKRLLNDKMEAMLRPMLQEWLDTNLPPLVERLVREEIERVVRRG